MAKTIKNMVLVVLLTALIWAWAEQSQTTTLEKQEVTLRVVVPLEYGEVVADSEAGPWRYSLENRVLADFVGPQSGINKLSRLIPANEYPRSYQLPAGEAGRQLVQIPLADVLNSQPEMNELHCSAGNVLPTRWNIYVSRLQEYNLPVRPVYHYSSTEHGKPSWEEQEVTVQLPVRLWNALEPSQRVLTPSVDVPAGAGVFEPLTVRVPTSFRGFAITPQPEVLSVKFDLVQRRQEFANFQVMPVYPLDFEHDKFMLESDKEQWRKSIVVEGPGTLLAESVHAYLEFQLNDVRDTEAKLSREIEIIVPPGYKVIQPKSGDPDRRIYFRFIKRSDTTATPP